MTRPTAPDGGRGVLPKNQVIVELRQFAAGEAPPAVAASLVTGRESVTEALAVATTRMALAKPRDVRAVAADEIWLIAGPAGSGKTAMLETVAGAVTKIAHPGASMMVPGALGVTQHVFEAPECLPAFLASTLAATHGSWSRCSLTGWMPPDLPTSAKRLAMAERWLDVTLPLTDTLVLCLDDLDRLPPPDTAGRRSAWEWLAKGSHGRRVVTVIAARDEGIVERMGLDPERVARRRFDLGPLARTEVAEWGRRLFHAFDPDLRWRQAAGWDQQGISLMLDFIWRATGGHPARVGRCLAEAARAWADALEGERTIDPTGIERSAAG